jgi:hypothetical protein
MTGIKDDDLIDAQDKGMNRSNSARCGHVKRRIATGKPLKGKLLAFALDLIDENINGTASSEPDKMLKSIADKMQKGTALTDYEVHIMVETVLLSKRLSG